MVTYDALKKAIIEGNVEAVKGEVSKALDEGVEAPSILREGLIGGMGIVGERFGSGEMFLPEVLLSADVMHKGLDILRPLLAEAEQKAMGTIVVGTVEDDIHDIGKRIVGFLLEGNGFRVIDLGTNVKAEAFAQAIEENKPDILGMSALLTTTMLNMGKTINLLKEKGLREKIKVVVGGAPINEDFAEKIGADGYAPNAGSGVEWVKKEMAR